MIYFFTGQPGAGKTTLAWRLAYSLIFKKHNALVIDGDDIREIFQNKDYSEAGRRRNIELAQNIAQFLHKKKQTAVVSLIAPYKDQRDAFRKRIGSENYKEIYVHTTDVRGRENFHVKEYEKPTDNYIDIDTTNVSVDDSVLELIVKLKI